MAPGLTVDVIGEGLAPKSAELTLNASQDASRWPSCDGCGEKFEPARKNQKFCRPSCRKSAFRSRQLELQEMLYVEPDPGRPD